MRGWEERQHAIGGATKKAKLKRDRLARYRIDCPTITGAGTSTFEFEAASGVYTELQCGSYIFMDADYGRNLDRDGSPTKAFEPSLFVWAAVMSRPTQDRAIVDAGLKALAFDSGPPVVCDEPAATYERASDEHGRLGISGATNRLNIGDKVRLIPGHCDPTVNLYDWYVCIRGNRVEQLWPPPLRDRGRRRASAKRRVGGWYLRYDGIASENGSVREIVRRSDPAAHPHGARRNLWRSHRAAGAVRLARAGRRERGVRLRRRSVSSGSNRPLERISPAGRPQNRDSGRDGRIPGSAAFSGGILSRPHPADARDPPRWRRSVKPETAQYLDKARQALKEAHATAGIELAEAAGRAA